MAIVDSWTVLTRRIPVQTFSMHLKHYLVNRYRDDFFWKWWHIAALQWIVIRRDGFHATNIERLLLRDKSFQEFNVNKLSIPYLGTEPEFSGFPTFRMREFVEYYYGILVLADLTIESDKTKIYENEVVQGSVSRCSISRRTSTCRETVVCL